MHAEGRGEDPKMLPTLENPHTNELYVTMMASNGRFYQFVIVGTRHKGNNEG